MIGKRAVPRQRVFKAGNLEFAGRRVDCTVRNISALGATVVVDSSNGIPHEVVLEVISRGERYACYVIWRDSSKLGVVFSPRDPERKPSGWNIPIGTK